MFRSTRQVIAGTWEPQPETHPDQTLSILLFPTLLSANCHRNRNQHGPFARPQESMTEDSFIRVEGLLNFCPQNVSPKIMLHLTQPSLMLSPTSLQRPLPASEAAHGIQAFSPAAQLQTHGSLEETIQERMKDFGIIHNAGLYNPKWEEICSPVLRPELKNLRWQALATVSYPRNVFWIAAGNFEPMSDRRAHSWHSRELQVCKQSPYCFNRDKDNCAAKKSQQLMEKCAFASRVLSIQS